MRILHAADYGNAAPGGFIPLIGALARRLRERGDAFAFVVPRVARSSWHEQLREAGAELHVVDSADDAAAFARAWRPDVAHVHFFGWELAITRMLAATRARIFWHVHSTSRRHGVVRASLKTIVKYRVAGARVAGFAVVTHAVGEELATLGAPRSRIAVVPNAIDGARFYAPDDGRRVAARRALGVGEAPTILFFGRDPELKGADVLAGALAAVPGCTVIAVATPGEARAALEAHARVVPIERADDVVPLYWAADAIAIPSRGEGASLVLIEALACGTAVVASDLPALRESAAGNPAVRFTPVGDSTLLAAQLRAVLAAPRTPAAVATRGPAQWADDVLALYGAKVA